MSSLNIDLQGSDCNDSRKSIDISMQSGSDCDSGGRLNPSFGGGGLSCYPPCAHTHPIDGGAWGITVLDSTAWLGKIPAWNGTQFVPVSGGGVGGVSSFNGRIGAVLSQAGDYNTDIVAEGVTNLYWTPTRFNLAFSAKTTTDLTEGINLYFTDLRAISAPLTGYVSGAGTITAADSVLQAIQKLDGNISSLTTGVSSVFGRTGAVTAQSGDYNTDLVTEGITNLYWTNSRTINSTLTGYVSGSGTITSSDSVLTAIQKLNGNISSGYVPYLGATANVDLGIYDLNAQGLKITGVNGNGHLTLRWQAIDPTSSGNHTTFFANIVGDLKYKIANTYFTTFSTSANTSDRTYTFPDTNGTVVLGTGAINELTYWSSTNIISSLNTGTYPSLTEISYVKGVTSAVQTQINSKQPQLNGTGFVKASGTTISYDNSTYLTSIGTGTTNELTYWSGTNSIGSLTTVTYPSLTELSYVKGVTSAIQTQLNGKVVSVTGTANQINVSGTTSVTLSTPQNIATTSDVQWGSVNVSKSITGGGGTYPAFTVLHTIQRTGSIVLTHEIIERVANTFDGIGYYATSSYAHFGYKSGSSRYNAMAIIGSTTPYVAMGYSTNFAGGSTVDNAGTRVFLNLNGGVGIVSVSGGIYSNTNSAAIYATNTTGVSGDLILSARNNASNEIIFATQGTRRGGITYNGFMELLGGLNTPYVSKSTNYTLTDTDVSVEFTAASTATLPNITSTGASRNVGRIYVIVNSSGGSVTISPTTVQIWNQGTSAATYTLLTNKTAIIQAGVTNYRILSVY